jgi:hypothetical protein
LFPRRKQVLDRAHNGISTLKENAGVKIIATESKAKNESGM